MQDCFKARIVLFQDRRPRFYLLFQSEKSNNYQVLKTKNYRKLAINSFDGDKFVIYKVFTDLQVFALVFCAVQTVFFSNGGCCADCSLYAAFFRKLSR